MPTYTARTTPDIEIIARLPHKYKMELNKSDMMHLLHLLDYPLAEVAQSKIDVMNERALDEWKSNFRSSILQTIGIEEV